MLLPGWFPRAKSRCSVIHTSRLQLLLSESEACLGSPRLAPIACSDPEDKRLLNFEARNCMQTSDPTEAGLPGVDQTTEFPKARRQKSLSSHPPSVTLGVRGEWALCLVLAWSFVMEQQAIFRLAVLAEPQITHCLHQQIKTAMYLHGWLAAGQVFEFA